MTTVYLAGPIAGQTFDEAANGWRKTARLYLESRNYEVRCPLRGKEHLAGYGVLGKHGYDDHPLTQAQAVIKRDYKDVSDSHIILMNLVPTNDVSIGTMVELGWASAQNKRIIIVMDVPNVHNHLFVQELGQIVTTLEEALELL
jgi:nucleoside 2-deoxyribosyltransferase